MRQYIVKRLLLLIPTFFGVSIFIFVLMRAIPGDAALMLLTAGQDDATSVYGEEYVRAIRKQWGLDKPIWHQYLIWFLGSDLAFDPDGAARGVIRGDFGKSFFRDDSALGELVRRLPVSLELAILTLVVAMGIAIPIGLISAIRQDTPLDYGTRIFPIFFLSVPNFWVGTLLILFPAMLWRYLPPLEYVPPHVDPLTNLRQFIFPAVSLGAFSSAVIMRMTRSTMLEVLRQDYVRTAWAKGLRERVVIWRHALKNALIPVVTIAGLQFNTLLGGTVIIESLFGLPGVGSLTLFAVTNRDYPQLQANVVFFAVVYVLVNLAVDLLYGWLDPRIRYQ